MKKILLASTALVATAGVASAQDLGIALTGNSEMGVFNTGLQADGTDNDDLQFFTDIDVTFTMTGESDNGISFGANIDLDESDGSATSGASGAFAPATQGGEAIFVSFGGATLTMGDTDGALDASVPEMALAGGSLADDETTHAGFNPDDSHILLGGAGLALDNAGDGQIARFDYSFNAFTFSASAEQLANGGDAVLFGDDVGDNVFGLGVAYAGDFSGVAIEAGLGWQTIHDAVDTYALSATAGLANGLSFGASYSKSDIDSSFATAAGLPDDEISHYGLGVGYEMNAFEIGVNYGEYDFNDTTQSGYGIAALYDFGGGLSMRAGYGNSDPFAGNDFDTYSIGLRMNY